MMAGLLLPQGRGTEPDAAGELGTPVSQSGTARPVSGRELRLQSSWQLYDSGAPTVEEQFMMELVNRTRADPGAAAARLNIGLNDGLAAGTLSNSPKPPLAFDVFLIQSARHHSQWMLDAGTFSHTGVNSSSPGDRMGAAGYPFSGSWTWGENIAWKGSIGTPPLAQYVADLHDGLFKSSGHRHNLLNEAFDEAGIGIQQGEFPSSGRSWDAVMITQNFARSDGTPGPLVTGVVFRDANGNQRYDPGEGLGGVTVKPALGTWYAVSSTSGGYAFPYSGTGPLTVAFSGRDLAAPYAVSVNRAGVNVKLDVELGGLRPLELVSDSACWSPQNGFQLQVSGQLGSQFSLQVSSDLAHWQDLQTNVVTAEALDLQDATILPGERRFYRLRLLP